MKSDLFEIIQNPHGGWAVKRIKAEGVLRTFETKSEAEEFLRKVAVTKPRETPVWLDMQEGLQIDAGITTSES